jgi:hypothetical protein
MRSVTTNFAEPNVQNDPSRGPSAGSFTPWPRRIGATVTAAEPARRHAMSAEPRDASLFRQVSGLLGTLWSAGGDHAPGRASLFGKMTNLVKGG